MLPIFILIGFIAELIDSSLGMAYGVTSSSFLQLVGMGVAEASATTHCAEVFLTAASGASHVRLGNFSRKLFLSLLIPGVVAGALGAVAVSTIRVYGMREAVAIYLALMGVLIIARSLGRVISLPRVHPSLLATAGGFLDAVGGGGWGPIVTGTLLANGENPRHAIGSVNTAEFFVTVTETAVFLSLGKANPLFVLLILLGGLPSAFLGAWLVKKMDAGKLMFLVGITLIIVNVIRII